MRIYQDDADMLPVALKMQARVSGMFEYLRYVGEES
jgi:hypothetical protein